MSKGEMRLLYLLYLVIFSVGIFFTITFWSDKIASANEKVSLYQNSISKLKENYPLKKGEKVTQYKYSSIEDVNRFFLEELNSCGIIPTRYEITGNTENKKLEVIFTTSHDNFIKYILGEGDSQIPYNVVSMTVKPSADNVNVVVKLEAIYSLKESFNREIDILQLKKLLKYKPYIQERKLELESEEEVKFVNAYDDFSYVGKITNEKTVTYLILKKKETGKIIKIPIEDKKMSELFFDYNGMKYKIDLEKL